jgi:chromosome segregation ATPase
VLAIDECLSAVLPTARHSHPFWARQRVAVLQQELTGCERERSRLSAQASATQQRVTELASERAEWVGRTSAAEKKVAELSEELRRARRPGEIDLTGAGGEAAPLPPEQQHALEMKRRYNQQQEQLVVRVKQEKVGGTF